MPSADDFIRYEQGEMSWPEIYAFFQQLIDSGMAWQLQGHYGREAKYLISIGECHHVRERSER